jgi:hypothetical protein
MHTVYNKGPSIKLRNLNAKSRLGSGSDALFFKTKGSTGLFVDTLFNCVHVGCAQQLRHGWTGCIYPPPPPVSLSSSSAVHLLRLQKVLTQSIRLGKLQPSFHSRMAHIKFTIDPKVYFANYGTLPAE